jgi:threonine/homoserine/homoserine lactone efflux protein
MFPILASVFVISLSGVLQPGIMLAMVIAKSYRSPWAGVYIALGHAVIEIPIILLIYLGFARFFQNTIVQFVLSLVGGGMIIWMGATMFRIRKEVILKGKDLPYSAFTAGILTSALNPFFWLWWATIGSMLVMKITGYGTGGLIALTIAHWLCDLVWLALISVLIYRTHALVGHKIQEGLFIGCAVLLAGFGVWYLVSGITLVV